MTKRKVLITLDSSSLSEQILPVVTNLFSPRETELLLFSVVKPAAIPELQVSSSGEAMTVSMMQEGFPYHPDLGEQQAVGPNVEQGWAMQRERELQPIATSLRGAGFTVRVAAWVDEPADAIATYAHEQKVDVIAMATHGRSGMSRLLLGSVAEAVVRQSHIPVLLLRPEAE